MSRQAVRPRSRRWQAPGAATAAAAEGTGPGQGQGRDRDTDGSGTGPEHGRDGTGTGPDRDRDRDGTGRDRTAPGLLGAGPRSLRLPPGPRRPVAGQRGRSFRFRPGRAAAMGRKKKTLHDYAAEFSELAVRRQLLQRGAAAEPAVVETLFCTSCQLPMRVRRDRILEHLSSGRHYRNRRLLRQHGLRGPRLL